MAPHACGDDPGAAPPRALTQMNLTVADDPWDGLDVLLHPGLHKTGTSWLQRMLLAPHRGAPFLALADPLDAITAFVLPGEGSFDPAAARRALAPLARAARASGQIPVISAEDLGGVPFQDRFTRGVVARRLVRAFPQAKVLLTIREQDAVILSMYGQYVRYGHSASLEEFVTRVPPETGFVGVLDYAYYEYDRLADLYQGLFAEVTLVPYETIFADTQAFYDRLASLFGRTAPPLPGGASRVNPAASRPARAAARLVNRFHEPELRAVRRPRPNPNAVAYQVDRLVPKRWRRAGAAKDRALVRAHVGDAYAASNARLAKRLGLDLAALGYRTGAEDASIR